MTKRIFFLLVCAAIAAMPLVWMFTSPNAGSELLKWAKLIGLA